MNTIRIDRDSNATVPKGYTLVDTEIEFVKLATCGVPIQIRGDSLCRWAIAYFDARRIKYIETQSCREELKILLPNANEQEVDNLAHLLESEFDTLDQPLSAVGILRNVAPLSIWYATPTIAHLAEWLVWLSSDPRCSVLSPLFHQVTSEWQAETLPFASKYYAIHDKAGAISALRSWLGITDRTEFEVRQEFPIEVPLTLKQEAIEVWREEIICSKGERYCELAKQRIPFTLKNLAAEEAYQYYIRNHSDLSTTRLESLIPHLSANRISKLRAIIPPPLPSALPSSPGDVISWYLLEYLPYREWQQASGLESQCEEISRSAREFELWYIGEYPRGIYGGNLHSWLSFNKIHRAFCSNGDLTLIIILDGMHVPDSRTLLHSILSQTKRLEVTANEYVFAPIPTVTRFAKDALLKGVPPHLAENLPPLGDILPEKHSPAIHLRTAETGKIYFWRILEPDDTYHRKNSSENLRHDVEGRLEAEASKIQAIVENIPDNINLQIILTTDHGRLLSETKRMIAVPEKMESHGRAAWGRSPFSVVDEDYRIEEDIVYLNRESFGIPVDVAIPLSDGAFRDNSDRTGTKLYPHGGLFPEEIILPWIVLTRDVKEPELTMNISGKGRARSESVCQVSLINKGDVDVVLERITITLARGAPLIYESEYLVAARSTKEFNLSLAPWPSAGELESVQVGARVRLPNQMVYEFPVATDMISEDIYLRPKENILEDLL